MSALSYAEFKRVGNAKVVRERDRRRTRELLVVLAAVLPVTAVLVAYTGIRLQTIEMGYRLEARRGEVSRLQEEQRRLRLKLAAETSPERASAFASRESFGPPRAGQILYLKPGGRP